MATVDQTILRNADAEVRLAAASVFSCVEGIEEGLQRLPEDMRHRVGELLRETANLADLLNALPRFHLEYQALSDAARGDATWAEVRQSILHPSNREAMKEVLNSAPPAKLYSTEGDEIRFFKLPETSSEKVILGHVFSVKRWGS